MPLSKDQILHAVEEYRDRIRRNGIREQNVAVDQYPILHYAVLGHMYSILDEIERFVQAGQLDEATRWVYFSQGVLWSRGMFSLKELEVQVHSRQEPPTPR